MWNEKLNIVIANGKPIACFYHRHEAERFVNEQYTGPWYRGWIDEGVDDRWRAAKITLDETIMPLQRQIVFSIVEIPFNPIVSRWDVTNGNPATTYYWEDFPLPVPPE